MRLTKILLFVFSFLLALSSISAYGLEKQYYFIIEFDGENFLLNYSDKRLAWESLKLDMHKAYYELVPGVSYKDFLYRYELLHEDVFLADGFFSIINSFFVNPPSHCFDEDDVLSSDEDCISQVMLDTFFFSTSIPYYPKGTVVNLYDPEGSPILSVDVSEFANYCGNGICGFGESYYTCPNDCEEEPVFYEGVLAYKNYFIDFSDKLIVYNSEQCLQDNSGFNCIENLDDKTNFFSIKEDELHFSFLNSPMHILFEEDSRIFLNNNGYEISISNDDFKISFDALSGFSPVSKEFVFEGKTCTEVFNPYNNVNVLVRNC